MTRQTALTDEEIRSITDSLGSVLPWPRLDSLIAMAKNAARYGRCDWQLAPIWAEKLRHTYAQVQELDYPELAAAMGNVLPIDTSPSPASIEWEYFQIEYAGYADFIDEEGDVAPTGSLKARRFTGKMHEIGDKYVVNMFDLERAAAVKGPPKISIVAEYQRGSKENHERTTNWVWLFGNKERELLGFLTHPNITVSVAPLNAGSSSRLWANKSNDEIVSDIIALIDTIPTVTKRKRHAAKVWMAEGMFRELRNRRLATTDGSLTSLLDYVRNLYSGDDSGQGKVEFKILNECSPDYRVHFKSGTDESGLSGECMIAVADLSKDDACFIKARPYTTLPPQEQEFKVSTLTHSKIGGCKLREPLAVHRMDFGLV